MVRYIAKCHTSPLLGVRLKVDRGATAVEYALIVAFIVLLMIGGVVALGGSLNTFFDQSTSSVVVP